MVTKELQLPETSKLQTKVDEGKSKAEIILKETRKNYDLVVLGATEQSSSKMALFNPLVDRIVRDAGCSTLIVKSHLPQLQAENCPLTLAKFEHILVPTVGSEYSKNALEIASTIAAQTQGLVTVVNVLASPQIEYIYYDRQRLALAEEMAINMVE